MKTNFVSYLEHPLVIVGAILFFVLAAFKLFLSSGILPPPAQKEVPPIIHKILNFGFVIALSVTVLGFGLEYWKTYKQIDRIKQAKLSIVAEVMSNITSIDHRLDYIYKTVEPDTFNFQLDTIRQKVSPSLKQNFHSNYNRLIYAEKASTLRQMMNSSPLRTGAGHSELENLHQSGVDPEKYHLFYNQLANVESVTENLFSRLDYAATVSDETNELLTSYIQSKINLEVWNINIESHYAHLMALQLFNEVTKSPHAVPLPETIQPTLGNLTYLRPNHLVSQEKINHMVENLIREKNLYNEYKAESLEVGKQILNEALDQYANLDQQLKINKDDTWAEVVGKAVSLRQLGRKTEAVAAFSRYSDMFSPTDPTAKQYAQTAQQFTMKMDSLNLLGGVYVYEISPNSIAQRAGLGVGDIIIEYHGYPISGMSNYLEASNAVGTAQSVSMVWLRLDPSNKFKRYQRTIPAGSLGAGLMPI
jgi:hypothetical protein